MVATLADDTIASLQAQMWDAQPQPILRHALETYGNKLAIVTSFQVTGIVTIHVMKQMTDNLHIFTLDTGLLFPETYALMDAIDEQLGVSINRVQPAQSLTEQACTHGSLLWETKPDQCCHLRKTIPLKDALHGYDAWITGIRRDQSDRRANTPTIQWDERNQMVKYAPFATWTEDMLWTYIDAHDLPYNPLHDRGYSSIGCYTCTVAADGREGRWANRGKTECGIHVPLVVEAS